MNRQLIKVIILPFLVSACFSPSPQRPEGELQVVAIESFLADITQQVAGDRLIIQSLIPQGVDPHTFEPSPRDIIQLTTSDAIIINGAGFEAWLDSDFNANLTDQIIITASEGLMSRTPSISEHTDDETIGEELAIDSPNHSHEEGDPHFWLDPNNVIRYVENIRDGLIQIDPDGEEVYRQNAQKYSEKLLELDHWIMNEVSVLPPENKVIITNHESFGYYADRYGFKIIGTIIPGVSTGSSPSPRQLTGLVEVIKGNGVKVIFLESGSNPQLANQIASETGVNVVEDLYTHSITTDNGNAPSYIDMMRWNTQLIVDALR